MSVRKVIAQLQFNKYFLAGNSVLFKALQGYLCAVNSKPHLVYRSSFYVNSLGQFKTPKQTFPIDSKFTAVVVVMEFQSSTRNFIPSNVSKLLRR